MSDNNLFIPKFPNSQTQIIIFGEDTVANQVIGKITKQKVIAKYGNPERVSLDLRGMTAQHNLSSGDTSRQIMQIELLSSNCIYIIANNQFIKEWALKTFIKEKGENPEYYSNFNPEDLITRIYTIEDYQAIIN